eukprot:scaffold11191_cov63-Phaeocystis_antarctica.AAC.2
MPQAQPPLPASSLQLPRLLSRQTAASDPAPSPPPKTFAAAACGTIGTLACAQLPSTNELERRVGLPERLTS